MRGVAGSVDYFRFLVMFPSSPIITYMQRGKCIIDVDVLLVDCRRLEPKPLNVWCQAIRRVVPPFRTTFQALRYKRLSQLGEGKQS